jgi:hypothetical protein
VGLQESVVGGTVDEVEHDLRIDVTRELASFDCPIDHAAVLVPHGTDEAFAPYLGQLRIALDFGDQSHGPDSHFSPQDWRSKSSMFQGEPFERNLRAVARLRELAVEQLGITLAQLAVAWTLANPAVDVAIVGTRDPDHVDDALAAADIDLDQEVLDRVDKIMVDAVPAYGPSPETV